MLYLIGGAPRLGKSLLAQTLAKQQCIPWLSTDTLCAMVAGVADMRFADVMHLGTAAIVQMQISKAHAMQEPLTQFIDRLMDEQSSFVLEGVHLLPSLIQHIQTKYPVDVRHLLVTAGRQPDVVVGLQADQRPINWLRDASLDTKEAMAAFAVAYSTALQKECAEADLHIFERTHDFSKDMDAMVRILSAE